MIGDASVELGRYPQAFEAFEQLGELRPGLVAYARLSHSRELAGRRRGRDPPHAPGRRTPAGRAREHAVDARAARLACCSSRAARRGRPGVPPRARAPARSTRAPRPASARSPSPAATSPQAERWYDRAASHLPLPEIVAQLGDVRAARGDRDRRARGLRARPPRAGGCSSRSGGNADLETRALRGLPPGARARGQSVVALARKALAPAHPSTATIRSPGRCSPPATAARPCLRPCSQTASARSTRSSRGTSERSPPARAEPAVARAALERALAREPALPPARRPGGQAIAGEGSVT